VGRPQGAQELLGIDRADSADHARGKVVLDALDRCRGTGLEEPAKRKVTARVHSAIFISANIANIANIGGKILCA
jgi:hypothetical protein